MDTERGPPRRHPARALLDLLGLSARAGALVFGTDAVRSAVREGKVRLVVLAADAAAGQRAKLIPLLEARRVPYHIAHDRRDLGAATGRAPVSAIGFANPDLATRANELLVALPRSEDQQGGS
jgi:ribosomal protein L7Ae-like RNA K-turn-binding protein